MIPLTQPVAVAITEPGKNRRAFKESSDLRELRRRALATEPGEERRQLWKAARKNTKPSTNSGSNWRCRRLPSWIGA